MQPLLEEPLGPHDGRDTSGDNQVWCPRPQEGRLDSRTHITARVTTSISISTRTAHTTTTSSIHRVPKTAGRIPGSTLPSAIATGRGIYQSTSLPVYQYSGIPVFQYTFIPVFGCTGAPVNQYIRRPTYGCANIYSGIAVYRYTSILVDGWF